MSKQSFLLEKNVADLLGDSPEQIERRVHETMVLDLYRRHEVSAGWAAEALAMDKMAFIRWSGELGIPFMDTTPEDWAAQLRAIDKNW